MKTILVTGCAGFIGSHLCEKLLEDHRVIGIDNLSMGFMQNMSSFISHGNFTFEQLDVTHPDVDKFFKGKEIDTVFHFAANSDISKANPLIEVKDTFASTYSLLELCKTYNVKEFIFASSGAVYGETRRVCTEDSPCMPISYYGAAKLASEGFISAFCHMNDIQAYICRFPNVVGSRATHGVILDFISNILPQTKNKQALSYLQVLGNGLQTKPYMHVKDCIDAILWIWQKALSRVSVYNITGIGTTSVVEIAEMVVREMKTDTVINFEDTDRGWKGDIPNYLPTAYKLHLLGYDCMTQSNDAVLIAIKEILAEQ